MKIQLSWVRDYVDVPVDVDRLAADMTMRGFEVAGIERLPSPDGDAAGPDAVIDFEVTANRPDCLNVVGMAREIAQRYGVPLRAPQPPPLEPGHALPVRVVIEAPALCPVYAAAVVDVRVGRSPAWLAERLTHAGVRAINNVVDVTNYVLLELGQPMHAFDLDTLAGPELRVRTARAGERLTTLDGQARTLAEGMLVIADANVPQAVAGVMGGAATEVTDATRTVVLESACFAPAQVRRTRRALGLSTEASYRFERGTDPGTPVPALARAVELLEAIGAGKARPGLIVAAGEAVPRATVRLRWSRIDRVLGMEVPPEQVADILSGLGFEPEAIPQPDPHYPPVWDVGVPGWRRDVTREEDLIEEVARCAGYEQLPVTFPPLTTPPARISPRLARDRAVRDVLVGHGWHECVTFTFIERDVAARFDASPVAIANPLSETFAVLRPSLLPGVIDSLSHNRRRAQQDLRLFEVGTRFTEAHGETRAVALGLSGLASPLHWSGSGRPSDLFDMLGIVDRLGRTLGVTFERRPEASPVLREGYAVSLWCADGQGSSRRVGIAGQLDTALAEARDLPTHDPVWIAEIDLDLAAPAYAADALVQMTPLPRHPAVVRDVSLLVPADLPAATLRGTMQAVAPPTLVEVIEFDRYAGRALPAGTVSLSFRLTFRHPERTLTEGDVQAAIEAMLAEVGRIHGVTRR